MDDQVAHNLGTVDMQFMVSLIREHSKIDAQAFG